MTFLFMMGLVVRFMMLLMFRGVDWVVVDWDGDNMWLNDDWVSKRVKWNVIILSCRPLAVSLCLRDFDGHMNWIRNLHFLNHWNFNLLVHRELLGVMMMDGVDLVRDFNFDCFAESSVVRKSVFRKWGCDEKSYCPPPPPPQRVGSAARVINTRTTIDAICNRRTNAII